ncbi:MAG: PD-(D/E)XK nuclease family protein [Steroidobacteraceae bacterium]
MTLLDEQLEGELEGGTTVVTPSSERASAVRLAHAAQAIELGQRAWRTPDVITYRAWLEREAFRAADAGETLPRPLRAAEEWLLWREAAARAGERAEDPAFAPLSEATSQLAGAQAQGSWAPLGSGGTRLADALSRAARMLHEWQIPSGVLDRAGLPESELLARALEWVERRSLEAHALPSYALCERLRGSRSPRPVTFAGFSERSAARGAWMATARAAGIAVREHASEGSPERSLIARAADPAEELELAAEWAARELSADPRRRLLIIVPDLAQRRAEAVRLIEEALAPRSFLDGRDAGLLAVASGLPLSTEPLVAHGLTALEFLTGSLGLTELSAWLRDAFWGAPSPEERARLDAWLRGVIGFEVTPRELDAALEKAPTALDAAARALRGALAAAQRALWGTDERALGDGGDRSSTRSWARRIAAALESLRLGGSGSSAGAEAQAEARFAEILGDFAAMGGRLGTLDVRQALDILRSLVERTAFAPQTGEAAVTLAGLAGDPILRYDGIWVAGLHADTWPPAPQLDPFIPRAAQRRAGIARTTPAGCLQIARALLECWRRSAATLVLSAPLRLEDRDCLPSALLAQIAGAEPYVPAERRTTLAQRIRASRRIETVADGEGALWAGRDALPSGTRALDYQSRCPFRAYAELRLAAAPLEIPRPGIDPRERGRLMHRALEHLWGRLKGSAALAAHAAGGSLAALVEECVALAAIEVRAPDASSAGRAAHHRELRRAARLILELAAFERQRGAFRVRALEAQRSLVLAGARIDLRIDRIDELEDGTQLILDYKTGRPAQLEWLADRLTAPQLLAYLLAGEEVSAVAALHLTADGIGVRGMADRPGRLPSLTSLAREEGGDASAAWQAQTGRWRAALERLAQDFRGGSAAVDPAPGACRYCHLQTLCRVSERND